MDKKNGSNERKDSCLNLMSCGGKAAAFALLIVGGGIGFLCGLHVGSRMSPVSAASAPERQDSGKGAQSCASPDEAANGFLKSVSKQAWDEASKYFPGFDPKSRSIYDGITIVSVGKSVQSGPKGGVTVPYEIAWNSGMTRKASLAMGNVGATKCFVVVGGF